MTKRWLPFYSRETKQSLQSVLFLDKPLQLNRRCVSLSYLFSFLSLLFLLLFNLTTDDYCMHELSRKRERWQLHLWETSHAWTKENGISAQKITCVSRGTDFLDWCLLVLQLLFATSSTTSFTTSFSLLPSSLISREKGTCNLQTIFHSWRSASGKRRSHRQDFVGCEEHRYLRNERNVFEWQDASWVRSITRSIRSTTSITRNDVRISSSSSNFSFLWFVVSCVSFSCLCHHHHHHQLQHDLLKRISFQVLKFIICW